MREHLIRYVELLFAGAPEARDVQQEILQNTLDRYDDLIAQGKAPEAAYQLAISGIGDIREILGGTVPAPTAAAPVLNKREKPVWKKVLQAVGICLYILSPMPLFLLQNEIGLCGLLAICAVATALMVVSSSGEKEEKAEPATPQSQLQKSIRSVVGVVTVCLYLVLSFATQAWFITWILFPICGAVNGLIKAGFDLKEASKYEN